MTQTAGVVALAEVRDRAFGADECLATVVDDGTGGTAVFVGTVRDEDAGRPVTVLEYSAHPTAGALLVELAAEAASLPGVRRVAVLHRVGELAVGDVAVVAAVGAAHRGEAFDACRELVEQVKHRLPLWKRQVFADGGEEWVGAC